jgi:hypothetical protein
MIIKRLITGFLLIVVGCSFAWSITKIASNKRQDSVIKQDVVDMQQNKSARQSERVAVYYFHGDIRCKTCLTIESMAKDAVEEIYASDIAQGRVEWEIVNFDKPENEHFIDDFELPGSSLLLAYYNLDQLTNWKILQDVWFNYHDVEEFNKYINDEIDQILVSGEETAAPPGKTASDE